MPLAKLIQLTPMERCIERLEEFRDNAGVVSGVDVEGEVMARAA